MPSFMYGTLFVNLLLFIVTLLWLIFKTPDSVLSILFFLILIYGNLALLFSYPIYFHFIKKKHHKGLEKRVYRFSLKWGSMFAFIVVGILGLRAFDLWNILNLGLFLALSGTIVLGMLNKTS